MNNERRLVLLVPTETDMKHPDWQEKYWPNFVCGVQDALKRAGIDCDVRVVAAPPQTREPRS